MRFPVLLLVLAVSFAAAPAGCGKAGKPKGTAKGKVTIQGAPLGSGSVLFENQELGVSLLANLEADGSFEVRTFEGAGLPVGKYKVAIRSEKISTTFTPPLAGDPSKQAPPADASSIPEIYRSTQTSPLTADIEAGTNPPLAYDLK